MLVVGKALEYIFEGVQFQRAEALFGKLVGLRLCKASYQLDAKDTSVG